MKKPWIALIVLLTISCAEKNEYYTLDDFDKVDKIDTHIHVFADRNSFVNQAKKDNFRLLNIMVKKQHKIQPATQREYIRNRGALN